MSEHLGRACTRLKSCLRFTPPITPDFSAASSACNSGRTSPSVVSDSSSYVSSCCVRKTVSFCSDQELEEVFCADEWDRTPTAVTPKLSYQDILELKQLRINLPYRPPPPTSRQPFTTSVPSTSKSPFPISRFANTTSHTPSKWKNRSEPNRTDVDPEILPYLDAVPIRLLPLLPQSPTELEPTAYPGPHPQTPTPTAFPECQPTIHSPSEPPELRIESVSPALASLPPPPRPRIPNFAFVPLLPVEDTPPIPAPIIQSNVTTPPRRKFNMTFLPVNAAPEPETSSLDISPTAREKVDVWIGTAISAPLPPPSSSSSPSLDSGSTSLPPTTMSPPSLSLSLPPPSAFSTAVESDNEAETDVYTDTDVESDAPSTSTFGSSLPSPPCEYEDEVVLEDIKLDSDLVPPESYPRIHREAESGSYFPSVTAIPPCTIKSPPHIPAHLRLQDISQTHSSGPGQTPPLSVLYPSPTSQSQPGLPCEEVERLAVPSSAESDPVAPPPVLPSQAFPPALVNAALGGSSMTAASLRQSLQKKLTLEALPSPALLPPSPFELEPHANATDKLDRTTTSTPRSDATLVLRAGMAGIVDSRTITPLESPMLTVETVRASWDTRSRCSMAPTISRLGNKLAPSFSRRRS